MLVEPTTDRGRTTVVRIIDAACVLFARQGVRATTLDQIGRRAGVGRGQLYHFFADKSDLVVNVVTQQTDRVLAAMEPRLRTLRTAGDVRAWCAEAVSLYAGPEAPIRCPLGSLAHELGEADPRAREALAAGFARWLELLEAGFTRVSELRGLRPGIDPGALAVGVLAAYQGGVLLADIGGDVELLRHALLAIVEPALAS